MSKQILKRTEEIKKVIPLSNGNQIALSRPLIMGILNVTPDSFSDGSEYSNLEKAFRKAIEMEQQGADIVDIGGESARPGAEPVLLDEELSRVIPVIKMIRKESTVPISIDTYKAETARQALDAGADIVNDISALRFDSGMAKLVAKRKAPIVLMHMQGEPGGMQKKPNYQDCVAEILLFFKERISYCESKGIDRSKIILDPGIGFGKRLNDNLELLAGLKKFKETGLPLLVGTSRKSFIGMIHDSDKPASDRLGGSISSAVVALLHGADIVRVHDVEQTVEALKVLQAIRETK